MMGQVGRTEKYVTRTVIGVIVFLSIYLPLMALAATYWRHA